MVHLKENFSFIVDNIPMGVYDVYTNANRYKTEGGGALEL